MSFLAGRGEELGDQHCGESLGQPDASDADPNRHTDSRLQTALADDQLQRKLLRLYRDSRTLVEEQGVNTLYIALGFLRWRENEREEGFRRAPLLLIPVALERTSIQARFRLRYTEEDLSSNLTLEEKLRADFGLELPSFPDGEDIDPSAYFGAIERVIEPQADWQVAEDEIQLGFFSFSKLLMYRDLDPKVWPTGGKPEEHPILSSILSNNGFQGGTDGALFGAIDEHPEAADIATIMDADSSQMKALIEARQGRTMIIQGPPGTGKSQTIANLIADAVRMEKKVLFVAEKMAALDVVKRRLDGNGIGAACLELHSRAAKKKVVLGELEKTLRLGRPILNEHREAELAQLEDVSRKLTAYAAAANALIGESGVSPRTAFVRERAVRSALGPAVAEITIPGGDHWDGRTFVRLRLLVEGMNERLRDAGPPRLNPFWGSGRRQLHPGDIASIQSMLEAASGALGCAISATTRLAEFVSVEVPNSIAEANRALSALSTLRNAPDMQGCLLPNLGWNQENIVLSEFLERGSKLTLLRTQFDDLLLPEAWGQDVLPLRGEILATGRSWYRFLLPRWRKAKRELQSLCRSAPPVEFDDMVRLIDGVMEENRSRIYLDDHRGVYEEYFEPSADWSRVPWKLRTAQVASAKEIHRQVAEGGLPRWILGVDQRIGRSVEAESAACQTSLQALDRSLAEVSQCLAWKDRLQNEAFLELRRRMNGMLESPGALRPLANLNAKADELREAGLDVIVERCEATLNSDFSLTSIFDLARWSALTRRAFRERPELQSFDSGEHDTLVRQFQRLDKLQFEIHRRRTALIHFAGIPRGQGFGRVGIIQNQIARQRGHLPLRKLMEQAGQGVQSIKPVFLMSPLSVSQFLPPGSAEFDLVVFDEASQVKAADGFGALLRGKQVVVVGDNKQLPPTNFFGAVTREHGEDDDAPTADIESLLRLMQSRGARETMLSWHYRSRHESLIAFSNREFYESRLNVFPSPVQDGALGLSFRHVPETVYMRAQGANNPKEAEFIASAVMDHARQQLLLEEGTRESLLVAAFSVSQRDAIESALEYRRRMDSSCELFFVEGSEPFQVKNLENVQGDERDVVFISVGYGRDENGKLSRSFGPINNDGGERRLNVLCTRARKRCVVFSNFRASDLAVGPDAPAGVQALSRFLHFAETSEMPVANRGTGETESEFEAQVLSDLTKCGFSVDAQVGSAGYRVDLAVRDPIAPGRYLLGIECDGARYHSAQSARDRDRLREEVLVGLGWRIHRIWSTAWFHDPKREIDKVIAAINAAQQTRALPLPSLACPPSQVPEREAGISGLPTFDGSEVYRPANLTISLPECELHEVPVQDLAAWVANVVREESPVHQEAVGRRIALAVGVARRGTRIQAAMDAAIRFAMRGAMIKRRGQFLYSSESEVKVRDRSSLDASERGVEYIASEEIDAAIRATLLSTRGVAAQELETAVARRFGQSRIGKDIRSAIGSRVLKLRKGGFITERCGFLEWV
jgi:very-short-patch-repair endonuclease